MGAADGFTPELPFKRRCAHGLDGRASVLWRLKLFEITSILHNHEPDKPPAQRLLELNAATRRRASSAPSNARPGLSAAL